VPDIDLGDVTIHYEVHGPGEGTPIVLLHGLGSSSADWGFQVPILVARHRVLVPDLRGHGHSSRPRGRLTVAAMARDVAVLLTALGATPAHVVGLSLGGCVALVLALDYPAHVRSLTLVNAFARPTAAGPRGALRMFTRLGLLACAPMTVVAAHVASGLFPRADQRELYLAAVASLAGGRRRTYVAALRALAGFDVRRRLGELRCPTLVIAGARDRTVPLAAKRRLHRLIPGAELLVVDDSGHATPYDQAERFNAALLAFIGSH
jgi:pimeloyl-ACP methyl ester carboxylesterase